MRFTDYRTFKTAIGGKLLQLEIGKVCEMANGQVMVRYGDILKRKCMPPGRFREALSRGKDVPAKKLSLIQG